MRSHTRQSGTDWAEGVGDCALTAEWVYSVGVCVRGQERSAACNSRRRTILLFFPRPVSFLGFRAGGRRVKG